MMISNPIQAGSPQTSSLQAPKIQKVAIFTHGIQRGPFAHLSTTLARGFQELGVGCDVVVLRATEADRQRYPDVNVVSLDVNRAALSPLVLRRYLMQHRPDVLFSMPWYFNVVALWTKAITPTSTKFILSEHNICSLEAKIEHGDKPLTRILPLLMRHFYPYSDGLIAVAQDTIQDLLTAIQVSPDIPMTVIPNPIDVPQIQRLAAEPIDHPWFTAPEAPVVVTVARLAKQKQLDVLIRAVAQVSQPLRLLILGDGPRRADLETLCRDLGIADRVAMPGYDANPYRFMAAGDLFVLPSAWEGCPIALQEALACGAATIVTDALGSAKEIVEQGKAGRVVPTGDVEALALAIGQLLRDEPLREHYRQQARQRAETFQYQDIAQRYLSFGAMV